MSISRMFLLFILFSFIGWAYESIYISILERKLVNRGFLFSPLCPIYGVGALLVLFVFQNRSESLISLFLTSAMLISILEYITSWGMERMFHARWWDYSTHKFHINGRVCLDGAFVFGASSVLLVRVIEPFLNAQLDLILSERVNEWISGILLIGFLLDLLLTIKHIQNLSIRLSVIQEAYDKYMGQFSAARAELASAISDKFEKSEFYSNAVQKVLGLRRYADIRLLKAYPRSTFLRFQEAWDKIKESLLR